MHSFSLTVGPDRADIGLALSAAIATENPVGPVDSRGRGTVRLFNIDDNSTAYLHLDDDTEPDASVSGIPIPIGGEFSGDIQITPSGGVWCWANKSGTKLQALVVGWS